MADAELRRSGPSYTVDTLASLVSRGDLLLIVGSETFLDLLNWHEPRRVARLARLAVVPRHSTGFDPEAPAADMDDLRATMRAVNDLPPAVVDWLDEKVGDLTHLREETGNGYMDLLADELAHGDAPEMTNG